MKTATQPVPTFFLERGDRKVGPYTATQIRALQKAGKIPSGSGVRIVREEKPATVYGGGNDWAQEDEDEHRTPIQPRFRSGGAARLTEPAPAQSKSVSPEVRQAGVLFGVIVAALLTVDVVRVTVAKVYLNYKAQQFVSEMENAFKDFKVGDAPKVSPFMQP